MRRTLLTILTILTLTLIALVSPAFATVDIDCELDDGTFQDIRQMFTAEDNGMFFEFWSEEELFCACVEILYHEPTDEWLHERVALGAIVLISQINDPRTIDVLIDKIDAYPAQALYNLHRWPTVDSLNALSENIRNENVEARENAAEGLRLMTAPYGDIENGWVETLEAALEEISAWILLEPEPDVLDYFLDAHANMEILLEGASMEQATSTDH